MSWKTILPKEFIVLDREDYPAEVWDIYVSLFCKTPANKIDVIMIYINKIEYFDND